MNPKRTGMALAVLALTNLLAQDIAIVGRTHPTLPITGVVVDGATVRSIGVPAGTLAPWYVRADIGTSFVGVGGDVSPMSFGTANAIQISGAASARIDPYDAYAEFRSPPGTVVDFQIVIRGQWLMCCTPTWPYASGLLEIDVEGYGEAIDLSMPYQPSADQSRTFTVRAGPVAPVIVRMRVSAAVTVAGPPWTQLLCGTSVNMYPVTGAYTLDGVGCGNPVPELVPSGVPRQGRAFAVDVTRIPAGVNQVAMVTGFSNTLWGATPLPWDASVIGMTGCMLRADLVVTSLLPATAGTAVWSLTLPANAALLGLNFFQQAIVPAPGANPAGLVLSNSHRAVIGT